MLKLNYFNIPYSIEIKKPSNEGARFLADLA